MFGGSHTSVHWAAISKSVTSSGYWRNQKLDISPGKRINRRAGSWKHFRSVFDQMPHGKLRSKWKYVDQWFRSRPPQAGVPLLSCESATKITVLLGTTTANNSSLRWYAEKILPVQAWWISLLSLHIRAVYGTISFTSANGQPGGQVANTLIWKFSWPLPTKGCCTPSGARRTEFIVHKHLYSVSSPSLRGITTEQSAFLESLFTLNSVPVWNRWISDLVHVPVAYQCFEAVLKFIRRQ